MTIDIEKISGYLKNIPVSEHYNWEIPFNKGEGRNIFQQKDLDIFAGNTNFDGNVHLKAILSAKIKTALQGNDANTLRHIFEWIVHDWGGIRNGRNNIDNLYSLGIEAIKNKNLTFDRIASTSKILSFYDPNNHIIYDSRIAYSLNTIMLLANASEKFFPIPAGTNSKMNAFNIEVLIRMKHKPGVYKRIGTKKLISNADNALFYNKNEAYSIVKETILGINKNIYESEPGIAGKPFYTEMLLFAIADTLIYDMILKNVKVDIAGWEV
jgi:hypothetical protein